MYWFGVATEMLADFGQVVASLHDVCASRGRTSSSRRSSRCRRRRLNIRDQIGEIILQSVANDAVLEAFPPIPNPP
jgi:hypothetical protein